MAACGGAERPLANPADVAQVVSGTGDVTDAQLEHVRRTVAQELPGLQRIFDSRALDRFFVFVHESRDTMPAELAAGLHDGVPGFALLGRHQIHLVTDEIRRTDVTLQGVVRHELVHELLDQYTAPNGRHVPRWFHEGLAQLLAGDTYLGASEEDLFWRVHNETLFSFGQLEDGFPADKEWLRVAYGQSHSFVAWLSRHHDLSVLLRVARYADDRTTFERALYGQTGATLLEHTRHWREYLSGESGAQWRILFQNWFHLLLVGALPVLVLALMRRLGREERNRKLLGERERAAARARERLQEELRALHGPPPPPPAPPPHAPSPYDPERSW